ncbi:IS3 family transposase [Leuconostoc mesenteroides]|uniref:IS3 family transposase n=1 Tax=Leuconostoc mesenteroides TaxID=1245 RepID=UPI001CBE075F|nr:IS3 family transposase [Leuconostoc mesenteroides]
MASEAKFKLVDILKVLPIAESTVHYWKRKFKKDDPDEPLRVAIRTIWEADNHYGVRRVYLELRKQPEFAELNHKKVQRLMHEMGLKGVGYNKQSRKYDSSKGPEGKRVKNKIHRRFKTDRPLQKLSSDVTEFKIPSTGEKVYLEPILDMYNNEILAHSISTRPTLAFTLQPLNQLVEQLPKLTYRTTIHTDQGWQYRHRACRKTLKQNRIIQSMSRRATALDNAVMESFFNKLKVEIGPLDNYSSAKELIDAINNWILYYNNTRIQAKLNGHSPVEHRQMAA